MSQRRKCLRRVLCASVAVIGVFLWDGFNNRTVRFIDPATGDYVVEQSTMLKTSELSRKPTLLGPEPGHPRIVVSVETNTLFTNSKGSRRGGVLHHAILLAPAPDNFAWPEQLRDDVSAALWTAYDRGDMQRIEAIFNATIAGSPDAVRTVLSQANSGSSDHGQ